MYDKFNDPVNPKDAAAVDRLDFLAKQITLQLTSQGIHPRDQMALLMISQTLAMVAGLKDDITDKELRDMFNGVTENLIKSFREMRDDFEEFKKAQGQ